MEKTFVLESVIYLSLSPFLKKIKIVPPVVHGVKLCANPITLPGWDGGVFLLSIIETEDSVLAY